MVLAFLRGETVEEKDPVFLDQNKFSKSIWFLKGEKTYSGRIKKIANKNQFLLVEQEKQLLILEVEQNALLQKSENQKELE